MSIEINKIKSFFGISKTSAKVYVELLTHGELSTELLQKFLGISRSKVLSSVEELMQKKLITGLHNSSNHSAFQALSSAQLEEIMSTDKIKQLDALIPLKIKSDRDQIGILKYEGLDGIKKVYSEVLNEAKEKNESILAFENGADFAKLDSEFFYHYTKKRIAYGIKAYVITPDSKEDIEYQQDFHGVYTYTQILPNFQMGSSINIVGNFVMTMSTSPMIGTLHRNPGEAATWKAIFHQLWNSKSSPIK